MRSAAVVSIPAWLDGFPKLKAVYVAWMARDLVPIETFNAMTEELKAQSFSAVAAMNDIQRQKLLDGIAKVISEGITVKDFRTFAGGILENPAYADLVYRMNTTNAFQSGHYAEMFGSLGEAYPCWRYLTPLDSRNDELEECPHLICRALDGKVFRKKDAWARHLLPPNHFQCRCITEEISTEEAASLTVASSFHIRPAPGFDYDKLSMARF